MNYQVSIAGKRIADILPGMDVVPDSNLLFEDFFSGGESDCILTSSSLTSVQSASAVASPCFQYGHFHPSVSRLHLYSIPTATPGWRDYWRPRYLKKKKMQILEFNFDEDNFTEKSLPERMDIRSPKQVGRAFNDWLVTFFFERTLAVRCRKRGPGGTSDSPSSSHSTSSMGSEPESERPPVNEQV
jgi:hypothetical protein